MVWYTIKTKLISFFADIRLYWCGIILFGDSHYKIKGPHQRQILDLIQPGDVLLRRYNHYVGSVLVSGHYSHAAMYSGDNKVIHMLGDGITQEDILVFMRCDDMALLRCKDSDLALPAAQKAKEQLEKDIEYDYDFTDAPDKFYCTEFVSFCFGYPEFYNKEGKYIYPDDFLASIFDVIWQKDK